ncbi:MAG: GIY-YIG nuclease family protein [Lentisphaerae bacterium]|nr:GIY-YIG nuclease family protein [Lentisphaerota bacterium]
MKQSTRESAWSVYVLYSPSAKRTYVGCAHDVAARLTQHNAGKVSATRRGVPWHAVHTEHVGEYVLAVRRERYYKSAAGRRRLRAILPALDARLTSRPAPATPAT